MNNIKINPLRNINSNSKKQPLDTFYYKKEFNKDSFIKQGNNQNISFEGNFSPLSDIAGRIMRKIRGKKYISLKTKPKIQENKHSIQIPEKKNINPEIIKSLYESFDKIPSNEEERKEFLYSFFKTNLSTGEQTEPSDDDLRQIDKACKVLSECDNEELKLILSYHLKLSELRDDITPDKKIFGYSTPRITTYENIKTRNILGLVEQRMQNFPEEGFPDINIKYLGMLDISEYIKVHDLMQKIGLNDKEISLDSLTQFAVSVEPSTIKYMLDNDLFNPDNVQCAESKNDILEEFKICSFYEIRKMHKRGLLKKIPERKEAFCHNELVYLANLDDEEWERVKSRKLLTLKIGKNKYADFSTINQLAAYSDEEYERIISRNLLSLVDVNPWNAREISQMNDDEWNKILSRNIDYKKASRLRDLIAIDDKTWDTNIKSRGIRFSSTDDSALAELSEEEWTRLESRDLNKKNKNRPAIDTKSKIRLAKLSDEEFRKAQMRELIKEYNYIGESFSEEDELMAKLSEDRYKLYQERKIKDIEASVKTKKRLLDMDDVCYQRITDDIIPFSIKFRKANMFKEHENKNVFESYYKLAYLDNQKYEIARKFLGIEYFDQYSQLTADEIEYIANLDSDTINRLSRLLFNEAQDTDKIEEKFQPSEIIQFTKMKPDIQDLVVNLSEALTPRQIFKLYYNDNLEQILKSDSFDKNRAFILKINKNKGLKEEEKDKIVYILLNANTQDENATLKDKMNELHLLERIQSNDSLTKSDKKRIGLNAQINQLKNSLKYSITTTKAGKNSIIRMFEGFFANKRGIENIIANADFAQYSKSGLPLKYSRKSFIKDLNKELKDLTKKEQNKIFAKMEISPIRDLNGDLSGYDGIINLEKLNSEGKEGKVLNLAEKFILENKITTNSEKLNRILNSLIEGIPEFINIIGKNQHEGQDNTTDIHILSVLKYAFQNQKYNELSDEDKLCLKLVTILHDIAKPEFVKDVNHPQSCAMYAKDILNKKGIILPEEIKNRVYEHILNHHWLTYFNTNKKSPAEIAVLFRREGDIKIAQIIAEADMKGVKNDGSIYEKFQSALNKEKQEKIEAAITGLNKSGQILYTSKIITPSKIPTETLNGKTYKVINFRRLPKDTDLSKFGFEPNTTCENLRLLIHTVTKNKIENIDNVYYLSKPENKGFLSASFISLDKNRTYLNNKYGLGLDAESYNIANAAPFNLKSGTGKNFDDFSKILTDRDIEHSHRDTIPNAIKTYLDINDEEYAELCRILQKIKYISRLDYMSEIKLSGKTLSSNEVKNAILEAQEEIMNYDEGHNEADIYNPKINSVIAKTDSLEKVPEKLLEFAEKNNLPIFLL